MSTQEQASSIADVESRFIATLERIEHAQIVIQKKEELTHMERREAEKKILQNQVQSLLHDSLKLKLHKSCMDGPVINDMHRGGGGGGGMYQNVYVYKHYTILASA